MSIIYEALKKVEGQKDSTLFEDIPVGASFSARKKEKKVISKKEIIILVSILLLVALGAFLLYTNLTKQEEERKVGSAIISNIQEPKNKVPERVALKKEPVQDYTLEGIVYDEEDPFAIINGKTVRELTVLGAFRIDKINVDSVEMSNSKDNNKTILSLP